MYANEIWKDIPEYENIYQASTLGNIKSLDRIITDKNGILRTVKGRVLQPSTKDGYNRVVLCKHGSEITFTVHSIIAVTFLNHTRCNYELLVDHIDNNRSNNNVDNLQIVTARINITKDRIRKYSKYAGVSLESRTNRWRSRIQHGRFIFRLGSFGTEEEASEYYQNALKSLENNTDIKAKNGNKNILFRRQDNTFFKVEEL